MVTKSRKRKFAGPKKRFIGKPTGQIQERVQAVGPEHFGIVALDCAKRRSKWMLCDFYGKVVVEPTPVEHTAGGLRLMTQLVAAACREEGLTDTVVAVEMTGIYHKPVQRAFRNADFDTRLVHPFASNHYRRPLHPDEKSDDHDLEAFFHAAVNGYGLATLPVGEAYQSLQAVSRHRHNLVKQRSRLMVQMRRLLHQTLPGFADLFEDDKLFHKSIALPIALQFTSVAAIRSAGVAGRRGMIEPAHDRAAEQQRKPITAHLADYENALQARQRTDKYISLTMLRIRRIADGCGYTRLADLEAEPLEAYLQALKSRKGFGNRTYNHYLQAFSSFCRRLIDKNCLTSNPVQRIPRLNNEVDVRHRRRALSGEEIAKLVAAARSSQKKIQKYSGELRARVYLLSYMTGLRRSELASLTPSCFDLEALQPTLTVEAAFSKHRWMDVLPLHPELVAMLQEWLKEVPPTQRLFPQLERKKVWFMVKKDLERAGIPYETAGGIADFHAAGRHSYITGLVRGGASLVLVKELARHADVRMTMRYTHVGMNDKAKALQSLPVPVALNGISAAGNSILASSLPSDSGGQSGDCAEPAIIAYSIGAVFPPSISAA